MTAPGLAVVYAAQDVPFSDGVERVAPFGIDQKILEFVPHSQGGEAQKTGFSESPIDVLRAIAPGSPGVRDDKVGSRKSWPGTFRPAAPGVVYTPDW